MTGASDALQELLDKQALLEVVLRYARALDRGDRDLFLSCFHPDAVDDHGLFSGGPEELADGFGLGGEGARSLPQSPGPEGHVNKQHVITNALFVVEGDVAWGESYVSLRNGPTPTNHARYLDRFERRGGEWRISRRRCVFDWTPETSAFKSCTNTAVGRDDPSYGLFAERY